VAKRKFAKESAAGGGARKKAVSGKKSAKRAGKRPQPQKRRRSHNASSEVPGRVASQVAVASPTSVPSQALTEEGVITATRPPVVQPIDEVPLAKIDLMRVVNNLDRKPGSAFPGQHHRGETPRGSATLVESVPEMNRRLDEVTPLLHTGSEAELLQQALWVAGGVRLPRAAIVGRALHELKSTSAHLAKANGTADQICTKIRNRNPDHLRKVIIKTLDSGRDAEDISGKLVGHLNSAWAVLEELQLLKAAYGAGVYLVGLGPEVFNGFPDWSRPDEKPPTKPARPKTKPPRS